MSITLVIVEDLEEVRTGLVEFLETVEGLEVLIAFSNAELALEQVPAYAPDIVIMDINLPGMSGIECIRSLKKHLPYTQFMMFTVYENDEKVFDALKAGASGYLLKNTELPQLADSLIELYNGGSPMSANIARKLVTLFQDKTLDHSPANLLSKRENEILTLLSKGLLYKEISNLLGITLNTVKQHIHKIYEKLHVQNRTEALNKVFGKS